MDLKLVTADFARWEGRYPHMYLDTKGLVTVGIGKMLPDVQAARKLGFVVRATGAAAAPGAIAADFNAVRKRKAGMPAKSYQPFTALDLPDPAIDQLLVDELAAFEDQLQKNFARHATYPEPVRRALLDMIYNLGLAGLLKFRKLKIAIEQGDWKGAAAQCHRSGPSDERNEWTRELFLAAAGP